MSDADADPEEKKRMRRVAVCAYGFSNPSMASRRCHTPRLRKRIIRMCASVIQNSDVHFR